MIFVYLNKTAKYNNLKIKTLSNFMYKNNFNYTQN